MSKRFRVLDYKSGIDGKVVDNAIGFWTKVVNLWDWKTWFLPWYSHTEIWVPGERSGFRTRPIIAGGGRVKYVTRFHGTCYSSTMGQIRTEGAQVKGTRKLFASIVLKHPERWDYTEFEVGDKDFAIGMRYMEGEVQHNEGYAKRDISKFFPIIRHFVKQDMFRNICSEFGHNACVMFGVLLGKFKVISPLRLARKMPWIKTLVGNKIVK